MENRQVPLFMDRDVDETWCIAPYGQNKIVYGKKIPIFSVPHGSKPAYSFPMLIILLIIM
jgi:hypothetical protein